MNTAQLKLLEIMYY